MLEKAAVPVHGCDDGFEVTWCGIPRSRAICSTRTNITCEVCREYIWTRSMEDSSLVAVRWLSTFDREEWHKRSSEYRYAVAAANAALQVEMQALAWLHGCVLGESGVPVQATATLSSMDQSVEYMREAVYVQGADKAWERIRALGAEGWQMCGAFNEFTVFSRPKREKA